MEKNAKIYVAGHRGMVGSAIIRKLEAEGYTNIITRTSSKLNLIRQADVEEFFKEEKETTLTQQKAIDYIYTMTDEDIQLLIGFIERMKHTDE